MTVVGDTTAFFCEWAEDLTRESDTATIRGVLDWQSAEDLGVTGSVIRLTVPTSGAPAVSDVLLRGTERLEVVSLQPDPSRALLTLVLSSLGHQVDLYAMDGHLQVFWIDEANPTFPVIVDPETNEPEFTYVRSGPTKAHGIVVIGPLCPVGIPAAARIDWAALFVTGDASYGGPTISAHRILKGLDPAWATWTQRASGKAWSAPGASSVGLDYGEGEFGRRLGVTAGQTRLLGGAEYGTPLGADLDANKTALVPYLLRASGANATARFYSELGDNGGNRPFLRVRYTLPRV
jgi:hypothetical protein